MADHPLRSAKDLWLGRPLPYQLPDGTRAHLMARGLTIPRFSHLVVLSGISQGFPWLSQTLRQITHVLLTRAPLVSEKQASPVTARLACVRHAASVRSEPGSNSPIKLGEVY